MEDYTNTNLFWGWAHMFIAHLMRYCGCETVEVAQMAALRSCLQAMLYLDGSIGGDRLSDNECILSTKKDWIVQFVWFKPSKEGLEWWLAAR